MHVALAGLTDAMKPNCIWTRRLRAAGPIVTPELAREHTVDSAVGHEVYCIRIQMEPSVHAVYLIKICVCDLCGGLHAEPITGWQQHMRAVEKE